jgi:hypothetical protein
MQSIDEKISLNKLKKREKDRIQSQLEKAKKEKNALELEKEVWMDVLKKENTDVERLEKISFANFFYSLTGKKNEKLDREKQEALDAKYKYDSINFMYQQLEADIDTLSKKIMNYGDLDIQYKHLLKEKEEYLKQENNTGYKEISALEEKISFYQSEIQEIDEAVEAGDTFLKALEDVKKSLNSASNWGTFDMLGGGFFSTMAKHSHLDQAKNKIDRAQYALKKLNRELEDVGESIKGTIELTSFVRFADYFFDGFLVDLAVQSKISDAQGQIDNQINQVCSLLRQLKAKKADLHSIIEKYSIEKLKLIETL